MHWGRRRIVYWGRRRGLHRWRIVYWRRIIGRRRLVDSLLWRRIGQCLENIRDRGESKRRWRRAFAIPTESRRVVVCPGISLNEQRGRILSFLEGVRRGRRGKIYVERDSEDQEGKDMF